MKKRALLSLVLILALLAALYLWYTRPRSFLAITGTSENAVCSAALLLLESWVDDGQAGQDLSLIHILRSKTSRNRSTPCWGPSTA